MKITRTIGIALSTLLFASGPALAATAYGTSIIGWRTADAVAARRVPGHILATRLESDGGRPVYDVKIHTSASGLEDVKVDAHSATVLGVHQVTEPGLVGEVEAP